MPDPDRTFVFCHRFFTASQLGVHLPPGTEVTSLSGRKSQYLVWFSPVGHTGWDALYVDDGRSFKGPERYADLFERVDPEPVEVEALRDGELAHAFRVYRCYGFVGRLP
jgi:hypothetical protein